MGKVFRRAAVPDLAALNALVQASRAYEGRYRPMLDGYRITSAQAARDLIVLAQDGEGGAPRGVYSLIVAGEPELDLMFVADAAQGTGLGARLFAHMVCEAQARGIAAVKIVSHPPSAGFYARMGARQVGEAPAEGAVDWNRPIFRLDIPAA